MNTGLRAVHPRVLVVGQAFDRVTGGGITLSNLFAGWPEGRLASVVLNGVPVSDDVCDRVYGLGADEIRWVWPLSLVPRTTTLPSGPLEVRPAPSAASREEIFDTLDHAMMRRSLRTSLDLLGVYEAARRLRLTSGLLDWVRDFSPDVIYSQLGNLPTIRLVGALACECRLPVAVHFMDDWPSTIYRTGLLGPVMRMRLRDELSALIEHASVALTISQKMAHEYTVRYRRDFTHFHNPVDLKEWDILVQAHLAGQVEHADQVRRLVYAGRIGRANAKSLVDAARAVASLTSAGVPLKFLVYTHDHRGSTAEELASFANVHVLPGVDYSRVPGVLSAADVLLLPLDFDADSARFARLSMPTKVSEYLAAGRAVLAYAPQDSAVAEYAKTGGWSLLVATRDHNMLVAALERLCREPDLRARMGRSGRAAAVRYHDARKVRQRFRAILAGACQPIP